MYPFSESSISNWEFTSEILVMIETDESSSTVSSELWSSLTLIISERNSYSLSCWSPSYSDYILSLIILSLIIFFLRSSWVLVMFIDLSFLLTLLRNWLDSVSSLSLFWIIWVSSRFLRCSTVSSLA